VRLIQAPESLACGPGLNVMLENFPLTQVLPRVFQGSGDCADASTVLLGISLAGWSLTGFLVLILVLCAALARR
jgi:protein dithiol:quinone oxidoreductase